MKPRARAGLLHRVLLRLHPRTFREEYGAAVEEMIATRREEAVRSGAWSVARFQVRETLGLAASLLRERLGAASRSRGGSPRAERRRGAPLIVPDVKHAVRRLARAPAFASAAVLTLALAIGANTAIYAVARGVVMSPLPYRDPERLVFLDHGARSLDLPRGLAMTSGLYVLFSESASTLEGLAIHQPEPMTVTGDGEPVRTSAVRTTPSMAEVLGVSPVLGRWFTQSEGVLGEAAPTVAVISHALWQGRFGADPNVLDRTITLNGVTHDIVGVMPQRFDFPTWASPDVWLPLQLGAGNIRATGFNFTGVGRLREGSTVADLLAEQDRLLAKLPERFPADPSAPMLVSEARPFGASVPLKDALVGSIERTLWTLLAAAALVLLIACANVANLFLVRAEARQRELAVRRALGATRGAVPAILLTEALLLALAGGVAGLAIAYASVKAVVAFGPENLPRIDEVRLDAGVAAFAMGLSVVSALLFGSIPLLRSGGQLAASLHESRRGNTTSAVRMRVRSMLVGAQVSLSLMLLVASGLIAKSFQRLRAVDPGFADESALVFDLALPPSRSREQAAAFHDRLLERVRALPGVLSAGATTCAPLSGFCHGDPLQVEGAARREGEVPPVASMRRVSADYFETMGMGAVAGRVFEEADHHTHTRAVVVDERLAQLYFPGQDPLGKRISPEFGVSHEPDWYTIVGVVPHVVTIGLTAEERPPQIYFPLVSHTAESTPANSSATYVVHTGTPPLDLAPAVRAALAELDPSAAIGRITTLEDMLTRDRGPMAFTMVLIAIAGATALALGLVGIYGVLSYAVSQRTGEIGVRIALGAQPGAVARMVLRQGGLVAVAGLLVGLAGAFGASRFMEALLFDMSPTDPATYAVMAAGLLAVCLLACWLPARRAARLDPMRALRSE